MGNVLCLILGLLIPSVLLFLAVRHALRPLAAAAAYRNVAWRLGLDANTRGTSMQGHVGPRRIWVGEVREGRGASSRTRVRAMLDLEHPLGMGLRLRHRERLAERLRTPLRSRRSKVVIGDPELDQRVELQAYDPDRVRAMFTEELRTAVHEVVDAWKDLEITDHSVIVRLRRAVSSEDKLEQLVDQLGRLTSTLEAARATLPLPAQLEAVVEPWRELAATLGLAFHPALPAMKGELSNRQVQVDATRAADGFRADIVVHFAPHPETGLLIAPQLEKARAGEGQDIQFGDPAFDDAFIIKGWDPRRMKKLLHASARADLLELAELGQISLTDRAVELQDVRLEPSIIADVLARCGALAVVLGW